MSIHMKYVIRIGDFSLLTAYAMMLAMVCGCSPMSVMSDDMLATQKSTALCSDFSSSRSSKVRSELVRRNAFTDAEWEIINSKQIKTGMSELALVCSWGYPGSWGTVHESTGRYGTSKQFVYRPCRGCKAQYVYVSDGKVSGWND